MGVAFLQTSDPIIYYPMLQETSKTVRRFCILNGFHYIQYVGIKSGNMPWKAIYNRIFMLKELLDDGFRGWAFHMDADSYIVDQNFDLESYLEDKESYAGIFCGHLEGIPYNVNSGGFAINYNHPIGRQLVDDYYQSVKDFGREAFDRAVYWGDDIREDQWLLHLVLKKYVDKYSLAEKACYLKNKKAATSTMDHSSNRP